jgi:hypothetical protein
MRTRERRQRGSRVAVHVSAVCSDHIDESGDIVFRHACKLGFEGAMFVAHHISSTE